MPRRSCLTDEELKAFNLGDLPESVLEELAAHLESCPRCETTARALDAVSDEVVSAYRESALAAPLAEPSVPPQQVGGYEILEELGRGGMGVVYKARHLKLQRIVALKMLLGGSFLTSEERARFRIEAEAVARLRHPNIIQIYEVGEHSVDVGLPRPFFTLEYAAGGNLAGRLAGRPQPPRQAASWLEAMARAAHYAHQQGIIHRDLKPSNVLLTESGEPMICDFGVAKLMMGSDLKTRSGTLLGTAEYMAPEQATEGENVGPAADVYSLGAILYTMLTGRPPFQGSNTLHILEQVRTQEPVPLRRLVPHLPRDLETICLKCLEKQPAHRYASAGDLADDLHRFLANEPILARPAPPWERIWKWAKRRPAVAGLLAVVMVLAALSVVLVVGLWLGAEAQLLAERKATELAEEKEREEARGRRENLYLLANVTLDHGLNLCTRGETNHGMLVLTRAVDLAEQAEAPELSRVARVNLAVWRRRLVTLRASFRHNGWVWAVAFSPDGQTALTGGKEGDNHGIVRRWDTRTGAAKGELPHRHPVWAVSCSPEGRMILTGSGNEEKHEGEARLWDAESGEPLGPPLPHPGEVHVAAFSPNGKRFLTVCDEEIRVYQPEALATGKDLSLTLPAHRPYLVLPHPKPARRIERLQPRLWAIFSPNSETVLTGGEDGTARLWDAVTGAAKGGPMRHSGPVLSIAFSDDGKLIATGSYDGTARIWDAATRRQRGPSMPHLGRVHAVALRFDNEFLATGSSIEDRDPDTGQRSLVGGEVRLWRPATGELFGQPLRHADSVWAVAFRTGGGKLLVGSRDRSARFYSLVDGTFLGKPLEHEGNVVNVVFSPNRRLALTASAGGEGVANARLWELAPGDPVTWSAIATAKGADKMRVTALASDGKSMLGLSHEVVCEFDTRTGRPVGPLLKHPQWVLIGFFSHDDRYIITVCDRHIIRIWDRTTGRQVSTISAASRILHFALSEKSQYLAAAHMDRTVSIHRIPSGERQGATLQLPPEHVGVTLHPDGQTLYTHSVGGEIQEWDVGEGKRRHVYQVPEPVRFVRFIGDKPVVVTGPGSHVTRIYDLKSGQAISGPLTDVAGHIQWIALSPDGRYLLTAAWDRQNARLWDTATGKPIGPPTQHAEAVPIVGFTTDGTRMMSGSHHGEFRALDVPQPVPGDPERIRCWVELLTGMELDAQGVVRDLNAAAWQRRRDRLQELGGPPDGVQLVDR